MCFFALIQGKFKYIKVNKHKKFVCMLYILTLFKIKVKNSILSKYIFPLSLSCTYLSFPF
jgi:hypothetical protein